jgi:hypothetical protein
MGEKGGEQMGTRSLKCDNTDETHKGQQMPCQWVPAIPAKAPRRFHYMYLPN